MAELHGATIYLHIGGGEKGTRAKTPWIILAKTKILYRGIYPIFKMGSTVLTCIQTLKI